MEPNKQLYRIRYRNRHPTETDPHWRWNSWIFIDSKLLIEEVEARLMFWRELNDYAVSQRGESARSQFEAIQEGAA